MPSPATTSETAALVRRIPAQCSHDRDHVNRQSSDAIRATVRSALASRSRCTSAVQIRALIPAKPVSARAQSAGITLALRSTMRTIIALGVCAILVGACGDESSPPECTGTSCSCPPGEDCDLGGSACEGNSCSLDCTDDNECTGACGASCSIDCSGGSVCDVTVGDSGSVTCSDGATCHVRCDASCSVSCSDDASCDLQCADDEAPMSIGEGGSCG